MFQNGNNNYFYFSQEIANIFEDILCTPLNKGMAKVSVAIHKHLIHTLIKQQ